MLRFLSASYCLGGRLRRYQHERLGTITTLTVSATPDAQIIQIFRRRRDPQTIASQSPEFEVQALCQPEPDGQMGGSGFVNHHFAARTSCAAPSTVCPEESGSASTKNSIANREAEIEPTADVCIDPVGCPRCKTRPWGSSGPSCLDCLIAEITRNREQCEPLQIKAPEKGHMKTPPTSKPCRSCNVSKPLDSFGKHQLTKDGRRHDCKVCARANRTKRACSR
jgi:hypothetical protein